MDRPYKILEMNRDRIFWKSWWFRIVSTANGQVICNSETYSSAAERDQTMNRLALDTGWTVERG